MALFDPTDPNAGSQSLMTQEQIAQQRKIAAALAKAAGKARPMTHPLQVVAQAMEGLNAGLAERRASDAEKASPPIAQTRSQAICRLRERPRLPPPPLLPSSPVLATPRTRLTR